MGPRTRAGGATKQRPRGASPGAVTPDRRLLKRTTRSGVGRVNGDNRERVSPGQNPVPARACVRWSALSCFVTEGFRQRIRWHRQEVPAHVAARTPSDSRAGCWLGRDRDASRRGPPASTGSSPSTATARVAAGSVCRVRRATASSRDPTSPKWQTVVPWGRPHPSHLPCARRKRITAESWGQSMG